jgi:hypothetical protein
MTDATLGEREPEEKKQHQRSLTFNEDGSIDPAQLEGMPQDLIDRVTDPEFQARARLAIAAEKQRASFYRGARQIRDQAQLAAIARRPRGVSGRQRKRLRRVARQVM